MRLLIWHLAHQKSFANLKFTVVLDIPAAGGRQRTLGVPAIRPALFIDDGDPVGAFLRFNSEITRRIEETRRRQSESYEMTESLALVPASLYPLALRLFARGIRECLGTLGISVIRETCFVIAAQPDTHVDGFIAIGRFDIPTEQGGRAGLVTFKGPPDKIAAYADAFSVIVRL